MGEESVEILQFAITPGHAQLTPCHVESCPVTSRLLAQQLPTNAQNPPPPKCHPVSAPQEMTLSQHAMERMGERKEQPRDKPGDKRPEQCREGVRGGGGGQAVSAQKEGKK